MINKKIIIGFIFAFGLAILSISGNQNTFADTGNNLSGTNLSGTDFGNFQIYIDPITKKIYIITGVILNTGNNNVGNNLSGNNATGIINNSDQTDLLGTSIDIISGATEFEKALNWMYVNGLTKYNIENEFRPNDFLTREEAAKIIGQAYKILGYSQEVKNQNCNFVDIDKVNPELSGYVKDVCKRGIFKGSSGQFMPKKTITRPEAMAVLIRMFEGKTSYEAGRFRWSDYYLKGQALGLTMLNNINSYEKEIPRMEIALYIYRFKNIVTNETLRIMGLNKLSQISGDNNQINTGILSSFATIASSISVDNDPELKEAISWMNDNGLTNFNNIQDYKPFELLTREQASKVLDTFSNVFNLNVNSNDALPKECIFSDINDVDASLLNFVENICKAGVLQGTNSKFNPKGTINKSQFIVAIIRLFEGKKLDESVAPRWKNYFQKAQEMGIVSPADAITFENPITRYEVALFLYRFKVKYQMLTNLNTNKVQNEIVSTVPGSIQTGLSNLQEANVYIDTNLINNGNFELGYIEILGSRYKVVRSSTEKYFSNNFVWYGDVFNMETEDQTGTVSFIISNGYLVEGTVRISENNYIIQSLPNTNAYYKIKRTK